MSLRVGKATLDRLEAESRRTGQSRSELARTLLEEGLRMQAHPGIIFRTGPAGRRAGLVGGPDVWEVVRVVQALRERGEEAVKRAAELTGLAPEQVRIAVRYYAQHRQEVDDWIRRVDEDAAREEAAWGRAQELLEE